MIGFGAVTIAACGGSDSDSDGVGSVEAFCDSLTRLDASGVDPETDFEGAVAALGDVEANAPGAVRADVVTFIEVLNRIDDAGDAADFAEFETDLAKMFTSIDNIQTYADENCDGLPNDLFD